MSAPLPSATTTLDPVCGMTVNPATAKHSHVHRDTTYYFCSGGCREKFAADPEKWLSAREKPAMKMVSTPVGHVAPAASTATYTCPMHPEVQQAGPGACPICGMALEPITASLDDTDNPELHEMSVRFWVAVALTLSRG